ncbi:hypothetical protein BT96DRAFT_234891 [Gymnopus androsaceus JB14]|uniref:Uncharacterized protein n=1 Tax=Gymnopus androsaceus JB14 TaxID=1447944 RepID=A0A6A4IEJ1_9AGAR|nr:hypothetical protein BT96DRAFT_234891 [Gymnopus androsaceus JB14]
MAHISEDWPGNGIIQQLVQKACGQFVYASTVLKYVGDYDGFPIERLEIILKITVPDDFDSPYPDLDLLYMQILSVCAQRELLLDVLAHVMRPADIFLDRRYEQTSSMIIEGLFSLPKGKVWVLLSRLHSVLLIPENDHDDITVRYASFIDFLTDRKRSGKYFIDTDKKAQHELVLFYLLKIILKSTVDNWKYHFECAQSEFNNYACSFWGAHFQNIENSFSSRLLSALNQVDLCGLLNTTLQYKKTSLKIFIDTLQSCLNNFRCVVQWAHALQQNSNCLPILDILIRQYRVFNFGFRIPIPSSLNTQARENLMVAILVLKTHLILYQPSRGGWYEADKLRSEMTYSLLTRLPDHPRWDWDVRIIMRSPWPVSLPILPLSMNPPQFNYDLWNKHLDNLTMIPVNYAECHKEMGLQCIWILSGMSYYVPDVILYARDHWINHILNARPSDEILQVVLDNMALLNKEDVRKALKWAEGAEESQEKLTQELIMRIWRRLKPQVASDGSGRGADSESVDERASQNKAKPNSIVEKPTKSVDVDQLSEKKVKHRWMEKLRCF